MKLLLLASILLTSVCASGWPYHEIVGAGQSSAPVFVAPVYEVAPAVSLLPVEEAKDTSTIVAGPVTGTTIVEGSSSGPVTIVSPGDSANVPKNPAPSAETTKATIVSEDTVLIKGVSTGPVTLIAPSVPVYAASTRAETKNETVATSAEAAVAIENGEESSSTEASTTIRETIGVVSAKAVIGPSTGPIVIAGPTAPPLPVATAVPVTVSTTSSSVSFNSTTVVNASVSDTVTTEATTDGSETERTIIPDTTEGASIDSTSSRSASAGNSETSVASAKAEVNSITSSPGVEEIPLSNLVASTQTIPSAVVSGPSASISAASLLFKAPLFSL